MKDIILKINLLTNNKKTLTNHLSHAYLMPLPSLFTASSGMLSFLSKDRKTSSKPMTLKNYSATSCYSLSCSSEAVANIFVAFSFQRVVKKTLSITVCEDWS